MEQFIDKDMLEALVELSTIDASDIRPVLSVIAKLQMYFQKSVEKLGNPPGYSDYKKAMESFKRGDEESAVYYGVLAGEQLVEAKSNGYQLAGYDFLIFLVVGFISFKLGLFDTAEVCFAQLDDYDALKGNLKKVREFCCERVVQFLTNFKRCDDDSAIHIWLMKMVGYWYFLAEKPGRIENENMLSDFNKLYGAYLKRDGTQHLKKSIMSEIMRYQFGCLIGFLRDEAIMKDTHGQLVLRVKGKKNDRVREKLNCLNTYMRELRLTEENVNDCGCYGFMILLISGVSYQLIKDYQAAVRCFEKAAVVLGTLKNPFRSYFEQIDFGMFEAYCRKMLPTLPPLNTSAVEDVENTNTEASVTWVRNDDVSVSQTVTEQKCEYEVNEACGEVGVNLLRDEHEDEVGAEDDEVNKDGNGWVIRDWVDRGLESDYSFANVTRSISCGVDSGDLSGDQSDSTMAENEKGLLIRYRDFRKARRERIMLEKIENLCPGGCEFVLKAKSPVYKQLVKGEGVNVPSYAFVVERSIPLGTWLENRRSEFCEQMKDGSKAQWWKFIKADVKRIFRGVIRGLWVLSSLGYSCLCRNGIGVFICNSQGKVKPFAEDEGFKMWKGGNDHVRDVRDLRDMLYSIIVYPFRSDDINVKVDAIVKVGRPAQPTPYFLDLEIRLFFELTQESLVSCVKFDNVIDVPFIWTKGERVGFLFKYAELVERSLIVRGIDVYITFEEDWVLKIDGLKNSSGQFACGEDSVLHALFWSKKCERYCSSFDVVRYAVNVIKHYNSKDYDGLRPRILKDVEIESLLRDRIPELYCALVRSISSSLADRRRPLINGGVCSKELFSRCFAKGECDGGCSPYMMCDHLLQ